MQAFQRPQIFESKCVICALQDAGGLVPQALRSRLFPRGGQAHPVIQKPAQAVAHLWRFQRLRRVAQAVSASAFRAEAQQLHTAHRVQQGNARPCEILRPGTVPRCRQLQHKVHAAAQCHFRPRVFFEAGGLAPLHVIPAHHGHDMRSAHFAGLFDLVGVAAVEGVVFRDDSCNFHVGCLLFGGIRDMFLRILRFCVMIFPFLRYFRRKKPESP